MNKYTKYNNSEKGKLKRYEYRHSKTAKLRRKEWEDKNKRKFMLYHKEYRRKNRELANAYAKIYRQKNKDKIKFYMKEYDKEYYIKNKDKLRLQAIKRHREYPFVMRLKDQRRRALEVKAGNITMKLIQMIYEDNIKHYGTLTCIYCLRIIEFGNDTLEHKIPLSKGGTNEYSNLAVACKSCNSRKKDKTEEEFKRYAEL